MNRELNRLLERVRGGLGEGGAEPDIAIHNQRRLNTIVRAAEKEAKKHWDAAIELQGKLAADDGFLDAAAIKRIRAVKAPQERLASLVQLLRRGDVFVNPRVHKQFFDKLEPADDAWLPAWAKKARKAYQGG